LVVTIFSQDTWLIKPSLLPKKKEINAIPADAAGAAFCFCAAILNNGYSNDCAIQIQRGGLVKSANCLE